MKATSLFFVVCVFLTVAPPVWAAPFIGVYTTAAIPGKQDCRIAKSKGIDFVKTGILRNIANDPNVVSQGASEFERTVVSGITQQGFNAVVGYRPAIAIAGNAGDLVVVLRFSGVAVKVTCTRR